MLAPFWTSDVWGPCCRHFLGREEHSQRVNVSGWHFTGADAMLNPHCSLLKRSFTRLGSLYSLYSNTSRLRTSALETTLRNKTRD